MVALHTRAKGISEPDNSTPHSTATYDAQVRNTIPHYDDFHEQTINLIKAMHLQPRTWLDTGCGTGTLAEKAMKAFPNTQFTLADPSAQMLDAAKNKLKNALNVRFLNASATQNLVLQKEEFDAITSIQSHHYLSPNERMKATAVCFELLSPRGVYVTFENIQPATPKGMAIGKENWKLFQLSKGRDKCVVEEHLQRFGVEYLPITVKEHISLLKKTGFSTVELLWYSYMQAGFYCIK
jgi:tRNA (cmo5U34)-methyltransferase